MRASSLGLDVYDPFGLGSGDQMSWMLFDFKLLVVGIPDAL